MSVRRDQRALSYASFVYREIKRPACFTGHKEPIAYSCKNKKNTKKKPKKKKMVYTSPKYTCPNANCTSVFAWKENLRRHLRQQCGKEPRYKCPYCNLITKFKDNVLTHIRKRHDNYAYVIDTLEQRVLE